VLPFGAAAAVEALVASSTAAAAADRPIHFVSMSLPRFAERLHGFLSQPGARFP